MKKYWFLETAKLPSNEARNVAQAHQLDLTKPAGSLGLLENIAEDFAAFQNTNTPKVTRIGVRVFAGDHGICAQNVSAFPQIVTTQMIENFRQGGAAISVLSRYHNADFAIVNMGTANPLIHDNDIIDECIAAGTNDFSQEAAMTQKQCEQALWAGKNNLPDCDVFIGGDMGIGNTSSASAMYSVLLKLSPSITAGPGTGVDADTVLHKAKIIERAVAKHKVAADDAIAVLRVFGGFEIAALSGAYIAAAQAGTPVLVDGFISTAAALAAVKINSSIRPWLLFSHKSAEPSHIHALTELNAQVLLDLNLRLGEGSGAALCIPIIQDALRLHNEMATFSSAGVSQS